jgi:hypothetical protein
VLRASLRLYIWKGGGHHDGVHGASNLNNSSGEVLDVVQKLGVT